MRPRTSLEKEVVALSATLPAITGSQIEEAQKSHCSMFHSNASTWCEHCGKVWNQTIKDEKRKCYLCPHCGAKLYIEKVSRKTISRSKFYFALVQTCGGFQVVRSFMCSRFSRRDVGIIYWSCNEVFQVWMKPGCKNTYMARGVNGQSYYVDAWKLSTPISLKQFHYRYDLHGYLSKKADLLPIVKRNGLKRIPDDVSYIPLLDGVINDPQIEILLKHKEWNLIKYHLKHRGIDKAVFPSIRVALRHGYKIKDVDCWIDMVEMLNKCGKDTRSPRWICPDDLKSAHDTAERLLNRKTEKEEIARILKDDGDVMTRFVERCGRWLGVEIVSGDLTIKPLQSLIDFKREGDTLHHCVFSNKYYDKEHTLILGARMKGVRTETIEVDTRDWRVVQCRGNNNQKSKYHDRILETVNKNINKFRRVAL